jgi:hypothetical protein
VSSSQVLGLPQLHIPEEPVAQRIAWYEEVLAGTDLVDVVSGHNGIASWLWGRWRVLERHGMSEKDFAGIVLDYRRELWLWLGGDRTWEQCCGGLVGRIGRRLA